ncbi:GNAT family N-acetyltransferase [Marinomonas sp. C2222]|uniref:GNAT family N-acetyltransferase n=1 Tax=Marinomonas sargassi TaxID=2984494 RepID=A0ABT2YPS9_9GAMM|nr:GNAT family N-acetyltransferase [Marinomonas sargassi]MCV2401903.1 GNAT family N-acetyltransferase [Marinomonas sargassi]
MTFSIRSATASDLPQLTHLYNFYIERVPTTFDIDPYTPETRLPWFQQFSETGRYQLLVAENDGEVVGYACSGQFKAKKAYETSVEVSIYISENHQGQGVGRALYNALFDRLTTEDVHRAYASITLPNEASCLLHSKFGFEPVGVFQEVGRKFGRYWDVGLFEKKLN